MNNQQIALELTKLIVEQTNTPQTNGNHKAKNAIADNAEQYIMELYARTLQQVYTLSSKSA